MSQKLLLYFGLYRQFQIRTVHSSFSDENKFHYHDRCVFIISIILLSKLRSDQSSGSTVNTIERLLRTSSRKLEQTTSQQSKLEVINTVVFHYGIAISCIFIAEGCRIYRKTLHEKDKSKSTQERKKMRVRSRQQRVCFLVVLINIVIV